MVLKAAAVSLLWGGGTRALLPAFVRESAALAKLQRRCSANRFEHFCIVALVLKAALLRNLRQRRAAVGQQRLALFYPNPVEKLHEGYARLLFEGPAQIGGRDGDGMRDGFQRELFAVVRLDVLYGPVDRVQVPYTPVGKHDLHELPHGPGEAGAERLDIVLPVKTLIVFVGDGKNRFRVHAVFRRNAGHEREQLSHAAANAECVPAGGEQHMPEQLVEELLRHIGVAPAHGLQQRALRPERIGGGWPGLLELMDIGGDLPLLRIDLLIKATAMNRISAMAVTRDASTWGSSCTASITGPTRSGGRCSTNESS